MGDPAGERAQGLHLVGLAQPGFEAALLGHVPLDDREMADGARPVADRHAGDLAPALGARRPVAGQALRDRARADRGGVGLRRRRGPRARDLVFAAPEAEGKVPIEQRRLAGVEAHEAALGVLEADRVLGVVEQPAQQRPLGGEIAPQRVALEGLPDGGAQQARIPGLGDVADDAAAVECGDHRGDVGIAGEQDRLGLVEGADLAEQRVAGETGHPR